MCTSCQGPVGENSSADSIVWLDIIPHTAAHIAIADMVTSKGAKYGSHLWPFV